MCQLVYLSGAQGKRAVPFHVFVKVLGSTTNVDEGGINLLPLQADVAGEGASAKVVLHYATMPAEARAATLMDQDIAISHSVEGTTVIR